MFSLLIADDNAYFAKLLLNDIISTRKDLKVEKIAFDGEETLNLMNSEHFDIVLLDLKMPIYDGIQIMEMLSEEKKNEYENSIIVITGEPYYLAQLIENHLVFSTILKGRFSKRKNIDGN